jgi:hypothetical protein
LRRQRGVLSAHAKVLTGSVLVAYQSPATIARLAGAIDDAVVGRRRRPPRRRQVPHALSAAVAKP